MTTTPVLNPAPFDGASLTTLRENLAANTASTSVLRKLLCSDTGAPVELNVTEQGGLLWLFDERERRSVGRQSVIEGA